MSVSHRKPTRRELRRAEDRRTRRLNINGRKMAIAAGTTFAAASIALGPALAQAEQINAAQNAQHDAQTWSNLLIVADETGKTTGAILAPLGALTPDGVLPSVINDYQKPTTENLTFIEGVGSLAGGVVKTPNTSHVPGSGGAFGIGSIVTGLPQYATAVPLALAVAETATSVTPKAAATIAALLGVDATTLAQNLTADGKANGIYLGGVEILKGRDKVTQHGGYVVDNVDLSNPLTLLGLPGIAHTTESWNASYAWPLLQANGKTWMVQESYVVDSVTSEALKANYKDQIGKLDELKVQPGETTKQIVDYKVEPLKDSTNCSYEFVAPTVITPAQCGVTKYTVIFGKKVPTGFDNKPWGDKTTSTPVYGDWKFVADKDEDGNDVPVETIYDPNKGVDAALENLNGIAVPGFSLVKREAGGQYNLIGDGSLGWLTSTTQLIVGDKVTTIPVIAGGAALPFGLLTAGGQYTPGIVTQTGQTTSSTLGSRSQGVSIPALGLGVNSTSVLESFQIGPDGIAHNSGWTIAAINIPGVDIPIPVVYSTGSFNVGPKGIGYTGPSLFGVGLPGFQLGENIASSNTDESILGQLGSITNQIPTSLIILDPKLIFELANIKDPTGLGLTDPFGSTQKLLDQPFRSLITPGATVLAQALADATTKATNQTAASNVKTTEKLAGLTGEVRESTAKLSDGASLQISEIKSKAADLPNLEVRTPNVVDTLKNNPLTTRTQNQNEQIEQKEAPANQTEPQEPILDTTADTTVDSGEESD